MCRDRIRQLEKIIGKGERDQKNLDAKNNTLDGQREQALNEKMIATNAVSALTREIEWINKQTDKEQQNIHNLIRERDMMKKNLGKVEETNTKNKDELNRKQTYISTLQEKLNLKSVTCTELMGLISQVEKERDTYSQDANKANANLMQMVEEVKLKKNLITELKKENMEYEAKMKQQQNLYEAVRAERNLYSKNCIEAQDEVIELKRKFKIASHNISNLKDEIDRKNQALTNEHHTLGMVQREKQKLTRQVQDYDSQIKLMDAQLAT
jgi:chromosome segregation ATPase